jgi:hypothetical protein
MAYFSPMQRLWLVGPVALVMYWLYCFAVTRTGAVRLIVGVPFMVLNALFNATCGTIIFAELPREWFFTDRLKRHKRSPRDAERYAVAHLICKEMNKADPGHC